MLRIFVAPILICLSCLAQTGSVQGTVVTTTGRQPVRKASVTLTAITPDRSYAVAITDSDGHFSFTGIPQGSYRIFATHKGFLSIPYGSSAPNRPNHLLELAKGQTRVGVTLNLAPVSTISGRVFDPDGDSLASVQIALFVKRWRNGSLQFDRISNRSTDQNGRYTINDLTAGQYWMAAIPSFVRATPVRSVVTTGVRLPDQVFATQFYPGVEHFVNAAPITVAAGQDFTSVDYHLSYASQARIAGSIQGIPDGKPVITAGLLSEVPGDRAGAFYIPIRTDRREFSLQGIATGAYRFWAAAGGRRIIRDVQLNADENRIDVELPPGIPLHGAITGTNQNQNIQIALYPADGLPANDIRAKASGGMFDLGEIPQGQWFVEVSGLAPGTYLKSVRFGKHDLLGKALILQSDSKGSLEITVLPNAPKITGTLESAGPATILAAIRGELAQRTALYRAIQTDEAGKFVFDNLAPGQYAFCALQDPEMNAWQDPEFLPKIESACKTVELKEGATETLQLTNIAISPK